MWPLFDPCLYCNRVLLHGSLTWDFFPGSSLSQFYSLSKTEWAVLTSPGGMWAGWRLREWGAGGANGTSPSTAGGLSPLMGYWPPLGCGHEVTIHHSHVHVSSGSPGPLLCDHTGWLGNMTRTADWHGQLVMPFLSFPQSSSVFVSSLHPSLLPRTNPVPVVSFPSSSHTRPELWVHSPLIHHQSYLSSGTIATEQARLRTAACRKIAPLPHGCGTLCIQQRKPSSLSLLHIKCSSLRVRKRFQLLCAWLLSKWNFYYCSAIIGNSKWLISSVLAVALSVLWATARLFLFVHCGAAWVSCESYFVIHVGSRAPFQAAVPIHLLLMSFHLSSNEL